LSQFYYYKITYRFILNQIVKKLLFQSHALDRTNESNRDLILPSPSHVEGKRTGARFVAGGLKMFFVVSGMG